MSQPTDRQILDRAAELLSIGVLASALASRLMSEFSISAERARHLARLALERAASERG